MSAQRRNSMCRIGSPIAFHVWRASVRVSSNMQATDGSIQTFHSSSSVQTSPPAAFTASRGKNASDDLLAATCRLTVSNYDIHQSL